MKTVADMREVAKRMEITGVSRLNKSELSAVIREGIETAHGEALSENDLFDARKILAPKPTVKREGKSYTQRMISRCEGYARQNGHEYSGFIGDMIARFTPAQRRRYNKKVRSFAASQS
jgi:hypothetical protein